MTVTTDTWADVLGTYLDVVESPLGSNCTRVSREYGPIGGSTCYAWCCALQEVVLRRTFGRPMLQTAAVGQAAKNAELGLNGLQFLPRDAPIKIGDLGCLDLKGRGRWADMHIIGVTNPMKQSVFEDIEGNWASRCSRKTRDRLHVYGWIRPPFDLVVPVPPPTAPLIVPEEDDVMFICEFADEPGVQWFVKQEPMGTVTVDGKKVQAHGTRQRLDDPAVSTRISAHSVDPVTHNPRVPILPGVQTAMAFYIEKS